MGYQIDSRNLAIIRREIKDSILQKIQEARSGTLSDLASIIYGDRADAGDINSMPMLWVLPAPHQPELKGGKTALHDFIFDFVLMVHSDEPESGKDQAEDLTARVYDVISSMRSMQNLFDVRPLSFDPSFEAVANSNVYWASCEFAFRIQRRE
jgi:hypothetical protein